MLIYPREVVSGSDFITCTPHEYKSNASGASGPAVGPPIILYMPNSTPGMRNGQRWVNASFAGPLGEARRDIAAGFTGGASDGLDGSGGFGAVDGAKAGLRAAGKTTDIVRQMIIDRSAKFAQVTANQMMAYSRGEIFNPNIELLYDGPGLRSFPLNFSFIPKDAGEAATVNQIILNFKIWSTPEDNGTKYKIPAVWEVKYGGQGATHMNKFKRSAITNIAVVYNQGLDMHATFENGFPIRTDLQLSFHEVDVITRKDHQSNPMGGGF